MKKVKEKTKVKSKPKTKDIVDVEKLAHEITYSSLTDKDGEFIKSTIGADDFKNGVVCGYNRALKDNVAKKWSDEDLKKALTGSNFKLLDDISSDKIDKMGNEKI